MATLAINSFTSYNLTEEENSMGSLLTITQKQVIHNHIAGLAEEKLALTFDVNNQLQFVQRQAELEGQISSLRWLLDVSEAEEALQKEKYQQPTQD